MLRKWIYRLSPYVPVLVALLWAVPALARVGGGEHYTSGRSGNNNNGGGGDGGEILGWILVLVFDHPVVGIPVLLCFIGVAWYLKSQEGSASTRKAFEQAEAQVRTTVSAQAVTQWVSALK